MFRYRDRSPWAAKEKKEDVKGELEGRKEKLLKVFEVKEKALSYIERPGSTVVILFEEVSFTRRFRIRRSVSEEERRRMIRCIRSLTTMPLQPLRISTRDGRM